MKNILFFSIFFGISLNLFCASKSFGGYSNFNSILIGERAAGMGGAYTALSDDPAACSFYNPATLARMKSNSLSATVSVYNKFDTQFGAEADFNQAPLRINQGSIVPIPASSGSVYSFKNIAFGLSILIPDFDIYSGDIRSTATSSATINQRDESLWVGGTTAINLTEKDSLGLTMYYATRTYNRRIKDQNTVGTDTAIITQEKYFSVNSLIYILGYYRQLNDNWSFGLSYRPPSLQISGRGSYFESRVSTSGGFVAPTNQTDLLSNSLIPAKSSLGLAYSEKNRFTISANIDHYFADSYTDLTNSSGGERINHDPTWNASLGGEYFWLPWLALRAGIYTNSSSHGKIPETPAHRQGDRINMWGFSSNVGLYTSKNSTVTLGGYYTGGRGESTQLVAGQLQKIEKSLQIFSFLVGTSFQF